MPEEKIDLVVHFVRGNGEDEVQPFENVSSYWAEIPTLVREKDDVTESWVLKRAYPAIRDDKIVRILEFHQKKRYRESFLIIIGALFAFFVFVFFTTLSTAPIWLLGLTGKNFLYIWSIGLGAFLVFTPPNPKIESIPIYFAIGAALIYVPIAFYEFFLGELGGINVMFSISGEEQVPTNQEIGEYLIGRVDALSTALVSWIPVVSAFLLLLGRTNLSKAVDKFKSKG